MLSITLESVRCNYNDRDPRLHIPISYHYLEYLADVSGDPYGGNAEAPSSGGASSFSDTRVLDADVRHEILSPEG